MAFTICLERLLNLLLSFSYHEFQRKPVTKSAQQISGPAAAKQNDDKENESVAVLAKGPGSKKQKKHVANVNVAVEEEEMTSPSNTPPRPSFRRPLAQKQPGRPHSLEKRYSGISDLESEREESNFTLQEIRETLRGNGCNFSPKTENRVVKEVVTGQKSLDEVVKQYL